MSHKKPKHPERSAQQPSNKGANTNHAAAKTMQSAEKIAVATEKAVEQSSSVTRQIATTYNPIPLGEVMNDTKAKFEQFSQDAAAQGKEHLDALSRSGSIFTNGFQEFFKTYTSLAQGAAERNAQTLKSLLSTKTLSEFTELQTTAVKQNFDDFLSGVTKLSELGVKLATETMEPINDQVSKTIKKAGEKVAA